MEKLIWKESIMCLWVISNVENYTVLKETISFIIHIRYSKVPSIHTQKPTEYRKNHI